MNLPNKLTVFRIILVPIIVLFLLCEQIPGRYFMALLLFFVASYTDYLDGKISKEKSFFASLNSITSVSNFVARSSSSFWFMFICGILYFPLLLVINYIFFVQLHLGNFEHIQNIHYFLFFLIQSHSNVFLES